MKPIKFACVPTKYAPQKKLVDFHLPQWRQKLLEFPSDPDVQGWVSNLYQSRAFKTREDFIKYYDEDTESVKWSHKPMIITSEDIDDFEEVLKNGGFDLQPALYEKLVKRMRDAMKKDKIVFVY